MAGKYPIRDAITALMSAAFRVGNTTYAWLGAHSLQIGTVANVFSFLAIAISAAALYYQIKSGAETDRQIQDTSNRVLAGLQRSLEENQLEVKRQSEYIRSLQKQLTTTATIDLIIKNDLPRRANEFFLSVNRLRNKIKVKQNSEPAELVQQLMGLEYGGRASGIWYFLHQLNGYAAIIRECINNGSCDARQIHTLSCETMAWTVHAALEYRMLLEEAREVLNNIEAPSWSITPESFDGSSRMYGHIFPLACNCGNLLGVHTSRYCVSPTPK